MSIHKKNTSKHYIVNKFVDRYANISYIERKEFVMAGTQVRVSEGTHQLLRSLANQAGESMQDIVEKAVEYYRRKSFLEGLNNDFRDLREDVTAWEGEEEERALWDNTVQDGLEKE